MHKRKSAIKKRKAVIIGAGHVGSHAGYALASQGLVEEIVYIDKNYNKAVSQALDIFDSTVYLARRIEIKAGDYSDIDDADIMIVCAGVLPNIHSEESLMDILPEAVEIMKDIVSNIKSTKFKGIIINISNPADVVTHYLQKKLDYNPRKIISTSTTLDSARLRRAISEAVNIDQRSIHAYVIGEHGESQVIPWSAVSIGGKSLLKFMTDSKKKYGNLNLDLIADKVKKAGWDILSGKGSAEFGIGSSIAEVARAILSNEHRVLPVSVYLNGEYGQEDVYASVPAVLGNNGVEHIIQLNLTEEEKKLFDNSCDIIRKHYKLSLKMQK